MEEDAKYMTKWLAEVARGKQWFTASALTAAENLICNTLIENEKKIDMLEARLAQIETLVLVEYFSNVTFVNILAYVLNRNKDKKGE